MMITAEHVKQLKESYKANKNDLMELKQYIEENGITDNGLTDSTESFEQGYNNALEYVFNMLGIKTNLTVEELKLEDGYEFECNMSEEYKHYENHDEFGCAFVWLGEKIGAEYNFAVETYNNEVNINCAIYKTEVNEDSGYMETDYDECIHYEINFDNSNWKEELENAMCKALIEFHNL